MENKKKILIIDDSALMRRVMSDIINSDQQLCVEDVATNGLEGIEILQGGKTYDLVMLDINMPKMDGVAFLVKMNELGIKQRVLLVSSIASKSTQETIRALELGAFDFIKKPDSFIGATNNDFKDQLLVKVYTAVSLSINRDKDLEEWKEIRKRTEQKRKEQDVAAKVIRKSNNLSGRIVFIATSTGGPKSLQQVVPKFKKDFPYPIVIVQHMPEGFTASLAKRLDEMSELTVKEAKDNEVIAPGNVYIAKGGNQCRIMQRTKDEYVFALSDEPARNGLRPCADVFLESLAETGLEDVLCGVMTGMGDDATRGLGFLKEYKDVYVVGQDEQSCVVYGMPRAAYLAGVVDEVVALDLMADAIIKKTKA